MRSTRLLLLLFFSPPLLPAAPAQEPPPVVPPGLESPKAAPGEETAPVLRKYRETHSSPLEEGLRSFRARASFMDIRPGRPPLEVLLAWKGPGKEEMTSAPSDAGRRGRRAGAPGAGKTPKKDWRTNLFRGLGDVLAGASLKAFLSNGDKVVPGEGPGGGQGPAKPALDLFKGKRRLGRAWFDPATGLLERITSRQGDKLFTYTKIGGRWVLASSVFRRKGAEKKGGKGKGKRKGKGNPARTFAFSAYRKINGFFFPTRVTMRDRQGPMEIALDFITVNGKPALTDAADPKETARKIKEFESSWSKKNPLEKDQAVKDLEELGGPKVALALARRLHDRSPLVREEIVRALGNLRERTAVPFLLRVLEPSRKDPAFFALLCGALGEIGDPRAVKPLAKKLLSGNTRTPEWRALAQARINAIGKIRSRESVDELIKLLAMAGGGGRRATRGGGKGPIYKFVEAALTRLTGERFKHGFEWRKWWKARRAGFFKKK